MHLLVGLTRSGKSNTFVCPVAGDHDNQTQSVVFCLRSGPAVKTPSERLSDYVKLSELGLGVQDFSLLEH